MDELSTDAAPQEPSLYERCEALFGHLAEVLTPERLLRSAVEEYNRRMAEFNRR